MATIFRHRSLAGARGILLKLYVVPQSVIRVFAMPHFGAVFAAINRMPGKAAIAPPPVSSHRPVLSFEGLSCGSLGNDNPTAAVCRTNARYGLVSLRTIQRIFVCWNPSRRVRYRTVVSQPTGSRGATQFTSVGRTENSSRQRTYLRSRP